MPSTGVVSLWAISAAPLEVQMPELAQSMQIRQIQRPEEHVFLGLRARSGGTHGLQRRIGAQSGSTLRC
jgi:hypothetical protein